MAKFKVGDKVKHTYTHNRHTIAGVRSADGWVLLAGWERSGYFIPDYYQLVEEKPVLKPVLDLSKPVTTRDGRPVRILCTDALSKVGQPVVGLVTTDGHDRVICWSLEGRYFFRGEESDTDLINPPVKKYINLFQKDVSRMYYDTREEAEKAGNGSKLAGYVKTIEVEL